MVKKPYKNDTGFIVTYPNKAIYVHGKILPNTVLVAGRGPSVEGDPSTVTDQIFNATQLGEEVSLDAVPPEWSVSLGLSELELEPSPMAKEKPCPDVNTPQTGVDKPLKTTIVDVVVTEVDSDIFYRIFAWGVAGFIVGLICELLTRLGVF